MKSHLNHNEDLKRRLEALESENKALKAAIRQVGSLSKVIQFSIGEYKGYPTISFDGVGRPFSLGLKKAAVVLQCEQHIRDFVVTNHALLEGYTVIRCPGGRIEAGNDDDSRI